ncbi:MAG: serine hydrolase [Bacteroidota bacterium]
MRLSYYTLLLLALFTTGCLQAQDKRQQIPGLALADAPLSAAQDAIFAEMERAIMADSFPNTTSVLLLQDGKLIYEGYFGYGDELLLNDTRSATKSLTALMAGVAIEAGLLAEDQLVFPLLPDLAPVENDSPLKQQVTVADLLSMSSALACNDNEGTSPGNEANMYPLRSWSRWAVDIPAREAYERDENGRGAFAYCTAGSFLMGQVIERVSGQTLDAFFKAHLFDPLGIETWQWSRSPTGEYMTGGGLRLRARDLAKIGLMVLNDGVWGNTQVIPASWVQKATSPIVVANPFQKYGYQFWRRAWQTDCGPQEAPYMSGNGGNNVLMLPELDAVVVLTRQNYGRNGMHQQSTRLTENYALRALGCPTG